MSVYKIIKLAQRFESEQNHFGADLMLSIANDSDIHTKMADDQIERLYKFARDFQDTQMPQGNPAGYAAGVRSKLPLQVAAGYALAQLNAEMNQAITGQGPLVPYLKDAYQELMGVVKGQDKMMWENKTGADIYNDPVYMADSYPHLPGSTMSTNVGARAGAKVNTLLSKSKNKFVKQSTLVGQGMGDLSRGWEQFKQTGRNMMDPNAFDPANQTLIGQPGTLAEGAYPSQTQPMSATGKDPLFSGGVANGLMSDERMVDPRLSVYWDQGGYSRMSPDMVSQTTAADPKLLAFTTIGPKLLQPLFSRFKELFTEFSAKTGGTPPSDDKVINDVYLIGAQQRSGLNLNEIAWRGIQEFGNAVARPQLTAAEGAGNAVGQLAGIGGNAAGTMLRRMGPPFSGITPAITNRPY